MCPKSKSPKRPDTKRPKRYYSLFFADTESKEGLRLNSLDIVVFTDINGKSIAYVKNNGNYTVLRIKNKTEEIGTTNDILPHFVNLYRCKKSIIVYFHNFNYDYPLFYKYLKKILYTNKFVVATAEVNEKTIIIRDSTNIFPYSLATLSQITDVKKESLDDLLKRCVSDTNIMREAFIKFNQFINQHIVQMDIKNVNTISKLSKRILQQHNILTFAYSPQFVNIPVIGGRTEIFKLKAPKLFVYDINSLYPFVFANMPIPTEIRESYKGDLTTITNNDFAIMLNAYTKIPECYIPNVPVKVNGKTFFPVGKVVANLFDGECQFLKNVDGKATGDIYIFNTIQNPLSQKIYYWYSIRKYKPQYNLFIKIILNSLYGYYNVKNLKEYKINMIDENVNMKLWKEFVPLFQVNNCSNNNKYRNTIIANTITSKARFYLWKYLNKLSEDKDIILYCDTDSIFVSEQVDDLLPVGNKLGDFKVENTGKDFIALQPKVYQYTTDTGAIKVKAKGFPKYLVRTLDDVINGIEIIEYARLRTAIRKGVLSQLIHKKINSLYIKREIIGNDTRPWVFNMF